MRKNMYNSVHYGHIHVLSWQAVILGTISLNQSMTPCMRTSC